MSETTDLMLALGEQVENQGKHITRLDELTRRQAKLIENFDERLVEVEMKLAAQALTIYGQNIHLTKTVAKRFDDIEFFLPREARQTLRETNPQANQGLGIVPREVRQG